MYVFLPEGIVRVWGGLVLDVAGIQAFFSGQTFPKKKGKSFPLLVLVACLVIWVCMRFILFFF